MKNIGPKERLDRTAGKRRLLVAACAVLLVATGIALWLPSYDNGNGGAAAEQHTSTSNLSTNGKTVRDQGSAPPLDSAEQRADKQPEGLPPDEATAGVDAEESTEARAPDVSVDADLAAIAQPVAEPVAFEAKSTVAGGIAAEVTDLRAVKGEAQGVGEVAGPAVQFTVTIVNNSAEPVSSESAVVNVNYEASEIPAVPLSGPDVTPFPALIEPGASGSATFVYLIPPNQRDQVRILLNYKAGSPIAAFEGAAPKPEGKP